MKTFKLNLKAFCILIYQNLVTLMGRKEVPLSEAQANAVVLLVPDYGNIGDLAIGYAQEVFLKELGRYNVISIPIRDTYRVLRNLRRRLGPADVVMLVGGGSMGDLYPRAQLGREFIARYLRGRRLVSFPQSIIYLDRPERAASARRESRALSRAADRLTLFAREQLSLGAMNVLYPGKVGYSPDIVLSLIDKFQQRPAVPRSGVLLALRQDNERALAQDEHEAIRRSVEPHGEIIDRDHGVPNSDVSTSDPYALPLATLELYRSTRLVVTDRLHGMIFAVVTGTPCVVLPNTNHKVTGTYADWIREQCNFIALLPEFTESAFTECVDRVLDPLSTASYRDVAFDFAELRRAILGEPSQQ